MPSIDAGGPSSADANPGSRVPVNVSEVPSTASQPTARDGDYFYFVHCYVARPRDESVIAATSDYGGPFCAAVARGRLFATQFHPEKSQAAGMELLRLFLITT